MLHCARSCIDLAHTSVVAACMSSGMNHPFTTLLRIKTSCV
jgi:hypothetical protein